MTKLNWRKFPDEAPENDASDMEPSLCLVCVGSSIDYDWYDEYAEFDEMLNDHVGKWSEHDNDEITHWIYVDDIPLPEDEELMTLNWRKFPDEVPEKDDNFKPRLCLAGDIFSVYHDWYDEHAEFDEVLGDYVGKWSEHIVNTDVTHWIYVDDIPLPEEA